VSVIAVVALLAYLHVFHSRAVTNIYNNNDNKPMEYIQIVAVLLRNDEGKVLMVQEAKESCRGQWYLPGKSY